MKKFLTETFRIILLELSLLVTVAGGAPQVEFGDSTGEVGVYDFAEIMIRVTGDIIGTRS